MTWPRATGDDATEAEVAFRDASRHGPAAPSSPSSTAAGSATQRRRHARGLTHGLAARPRRVRRSSRLLSEPGFSTSSLASLLRDRHTPLPRPTNTFGGRGRVERCGLRRGLRERCSGSGWCQRSLPAVYATATYRSRPARPEDSPRAAWLRAASARPTPGAVPGPLPAAAALRPRASKIPPARGWGQGLMVNGYFHVPFPSELRHTVGREAEMCQHRLVWPATSGVPCTTTNNVHHANGIRTDNASREPRAVVHLAAPRRGSTTSSASPWGYPAPLPPVTPVALTSTEGPAMPCTVTAAPRQAYSSPTCRPLFLGCPSASLASRKGVECEAHYRRRLADGSAPPTRRSASCATRGMQRGRLANRTASELRGWCHAHTCAGFASPGPGEPVALAVAANRSTARWRAASGRFTQGGLCRAHHKRLLANGEVREGTHTGGGSERQRLDSSARLNRLVRSLCRIATSPRRRAGVSAPAGQGPSSGRHSGRR